MTPFPESEDMTIKRLYVALKRGDIQLLKMGAQKLQEKFHTGHIFEQKEELSDILSYVQEQSVPENIKTLLVETINSILSASNSNIHSQDNEQKEENASQTTYASQFVREQNQPESNNYPSSFLNNPENSDEAEDNNISKNQDNEFQNSKENNQISEDNKEESFQEEYREEEKQTQLNFEDNNQNDDTACEYHFEENKSPLGNVAVFYDDKAPVIQYKNNKKYRTGFDLVSLGESKDLIEDIAKVKSAVDVPTDEVGEVLKMLNMIKGDVYFVTSSKSENIIKAFIENYISFDIPQISKQQFDGKMTMLIPLFGLSNVFECPKCGKKEYFGGVHNKVLSLQCKECLSPMYPDIHEAENLQTNANPYYWITGLNAMAHADTWIVINPPIEPQKSLLAEYLKAAYEAAKPKRVYIYSKEQSRREFYKQMFREIAPMCDIRGDFTTSGALCEEFINSEMTIGV